MNTADLHGLVELTNDEYHDAPGVSNSHLEDIEKSPLHYWDRRINPAGRAPRKKTPALILGDAIHAAILEPDRFTSMYAGAPNVDRRYKAGKQKFAEFEAENLGKIILPHSDFEIALGVRDAAYGDPAIANLLKYIHVEKSFFTTDPETGEIIKCRTDALLEGRPLALDIKSAENASPAAFGVAAARNGYFRQGPWYTNILDAILGEKHSFGFLAFEKERPFAIGIYYVPDEHIELGRRRNRYLLNQIAECRRVYGESRWPGYCPDGAMAIQMPTWYKRLIEEQGDF